MDKTRNDIARDLQITRSAVSYRILKLGLSASGYREEGNSNSKTYNENAIKLIKMDILKEKKLIKNHPKIASKKFFLKNKKKENMETFEYFWMQYPRKDAKSKAIISWKNIKPDQVLFDKILVGLARHKQSENWNKDGGKFIPYPATWLNQRRWEDEGLQNDYASTPSSRPKSRYDENIAAADRIVEKAKKEKENAEQRTNKQIAS